MKVVIVGGLAGGMSAATRTRRLDESAEIIVFEKGAHVSFANCGMPYFIGGIIPERDDLIIVSPERLRLRFRIDVRTRSEVTAIDRRARQVTVRDLETGRSYTESYDRVVLSPGASPVCPSSCAIGDRDVHVLRNLEDMDRIAEAARAAEGGRAVVVGGGFIGLELAENLRERGLQVALAEMLPQVLPPLDPEMAELVHAELRAHGVELHLSNAVAAIERQDGRLTVRLQDGTALPCAFAVLCVGVRPNVDLAAQAGLTLGATGGIRVNERLQTSDPDIYAVGDAAETVDWVTGRPVLMPLAGPASRQARIAADNICGRDSTFRGVQGTAIVRVFGLAAGQTGAGEKALRRAGIPYEKVYVHPDSHADYYPGASSMTLKLLFAPGDGRILGAQAVGADGVDKRIDVLSTAIQARMTVYDLEEAELVYAPQFGAARDAVNMAGFVAANVLRGDQQLVHADALPERAFLIDVRTPAEFETGHIPGAVNVPVDDLRGRLGEVPPDGPVVAYCGVGMRGYMAGRILNQQGRPAANLSGGLRTWKQYHPA
ncbi:MAG: FAD-dependent oxidoreductase [Candidatus Brocadiaceae bacterium]|nr:FAD-dependent oxidoreductase [Candidatus Brocadiaceae bacterium]